MSEHEAQPEETGAVASQSPIAKSRRALSGLKRELTGEELNSSGAQKLLLEELDRLREENDDLRGFEGEFHRVDKDLAVLNEKQKRNIAAEVISGSCLTIGAASLGYAPAVWNTQHIGWMALAFGITLIVGGVVAKAIKP